MWIFFSKICKKSALLKSLWSYLSPNEKDKMHFLFLKIFFCFHKMEITFIHNDRANNIYNSFIQSISHKFSRREQGKELSIIVLPGHGTPHNDLLKFWLCNLTDLRRQNVLWTSWIFQNWRYIFFRYLLFCKTPEI